MCVPTLSKIFGFLLSFGMQKYVFISKVPKISSKKD